MNQRGGTRQGYLVAADISGYTSFLTGTELEHAQGIIAELTSVIHDRLVPPLKFVKLEGDAIICYADSYTFDDGERLLELVEVCYSDFSDRLFDMARASTCGCAACAAIDTLDLKFVAHYGDYVVHEFEGSQDLAGPDVILLHRLMKNTIAEETGCPAYVFFTDACLQRLPTSLDLPEHTETYESLGETVGGVHDLKPVLERMREERREYVDEVDADFEFSSESPLPAAVLWQYFVDADKRLRWQTNQTAVENRPNDQGRFGVGATSHCAHGSYDLVRHYLDWRPFQYYTCKAERGKPSLTSPPPWTETQEFVPLQGGGTAVHYRLRFDNRGRLFLLLTKVIMAPFMRRIFRGLQANLENLRDQEPLLAQYVGDEDD